MSEYTFKTPPMAHQSKALELSYDREYFAYLMEMGTGKSYVIANDAGRLYKEGKIGALIYLAPKGAYRDFPDIQIPEHLPEDIPREVLVWQSPLPKDWNQTFERFCNIKDKLAVFVMNIEALSYESGKKALFHFIHKTPGQVYMAIDESTCIKNVSSARAKEAIKLGRLCKYRRIASGSPVTRSPMDMFGQGIFLSPKALGFTSFYAFRSRYAVLRDLRLNSGRFVPTVVGYQNLDDLKERVQSFSFRVLKKDCLDLPEKIYQYRTVEMSQEQQRCYRDLAKNGVADLGNGGIISTVGALALLTRLHQITCGILVNDDGTEVPLKHNRLDTLMEVLEESSGKVIIWANYVKNLKQIIELISKEYGEESVVHYYGESTNFERSEAKRRFQEDGRCRFFVGNPSLGRFSLTLTKATTVVYYSNSYDLDFRIQSEDRAHRIGQTESVTYIDLVSFKTMDEVIYKSLRMKINIAASITGDQLRDWLKLE